MAVGETRVSWFSHTSTNTTFIPKPPTTFLTCFSRGERRKYARKKVCLNWVSNSWPPGHESDTLTTEPPGLGLFGKELTFTKQQNVRLVLTHYQTTNFRPFQIERVCRRQFQIWLKWQKVIQTGRKHFRKRRNCSLHSVFKRLFPRGFKRCHCVGMG